MTRLEHQIRRAQHRLWFNRWLSQGAWCLAIAAAVFAVVVLVQRLFDLAWPLGWLGVACAAGAVVASAIWLTLTREDAAFAAAKLDEAAGLRERVSSGHHCQDSDDPFAQAVVADAERVGGALTVRRHIRLTAPQPLPWTAGSIAVAALMFLITPGLLRSTEATGESLETELARQTAVVVKRKLDAVREMADKNPALEDLKEDWKQLDKQAGGMLRRPTDIRHEAVKKIDKLADAVKKKRESREYDGVKAMRRMMRRLKVPQTTGAPTQKLALALQQGDFKSAKEEIKALREQLATLKSEEDKELTVKLSKQLDELAKQLEKLSTDKKLAQKLEQAGVKKKDLERMLENLTKKDVDQLKKQLEQQGMDQQQINKLVKQMQMQQRAGQAAKQLARNMQQAAQACSCGQGSQAAAGLSQAGDQLSELEQLEQEMNQLDATLADLQNARNDLDKPCSTCNGTGMVGGRPCSQCQGKGSKPGAGMGRLGRGRGGMAPEQQTAISFKVERAKVQTGKGAIIGQFLVDGEQVKGDVRSDLAEVVAAGEHDASDRINRNRIPRQYQKAVKDYFSNVQRLVEDEDGPAAPATPSKDDPEPANQDDPD